MFWLDVGVVLYKALQNIENVLFFSVKVNEMNLSYCIECNREFKNPGSLASHRYKFHRISASKTQPLERQTTRSDAYTSAAMRLVGDDLQNLDEYVASIAESLNELWEKFDKTFKAVKRLQRDMYTQN